MKKLILLTLFTLNTYTFLIKSEPVDPVERTINGVKDWWHTPGQDDPRVKGTMFAGGVIMGLGALFLYKGYNAVCLGSQNKNVTQPNPQESIARKTMNGIGRVIKGASIRFGGACLAATGLVAIGSGLFALTAPQEIVKQINLMLSDLKNGPRY